MNYVIKGDKVYRKGTLAQYLDTREISIGEPTKEDLPKTLNPFKFIMENLLPNCSIIKLKRSEMTNSPELLYLLDELLPPEQKILFYIDIDDINTLVNPIISPSASVQKLVKVSTTVPLGIGVNITGNKL